MWRQSAEVHGASWFLSPHGYFCTERRKEISQKIETYVHPRHFLPFLWSLHTTTFRWAGHSTACCWCTPNSNDSVASWTSRNEPMFVTAQDNWFMHFNCHYSHTDTCIQFHEKVFFILLGDRNRMWVQVLVLRSLWTVKSFGCDAVQSGSSPNYREDEDSMLLRHVVILRPYKPEGSGFVPRWGHI